jgi:hypothetical protein
MLHARAWLLLTVLLPALTSACGGELAEHETTGESQRAVIGIDSNEDVKVVRINVNYVAPHLLQGVLLNNRTVLTGARFIPGHTLPYGVEYNGQQRAVRLLVKHPTLDLAVAHLAQPMPIDGSTSGYQAPLNLGSLANVEGRYLTCFGYHEYSRGQQWTLQQVRRQGSDFVPIPYDSQVYGRLAHDDQGTPCFNFLRGERVLQAIATSTLPSYTMRLVSVAELKPWLDAQLSVSQRIRYGAQLARLGINSKCLTLRGANLQNQARLQQWSCHSSQRDGVSKQRFLIDPAGDASAPLIVSVLSGKCLDIPWGSTTTGLYVQQSTCHGGANQRFRFGTFSAGSWGQKLTPLSAPANFCLGAENGSSADGATIVQSWCQSGYLNGFERWFVAPL